MTEIKFFFLKLFQQVTPQKKPALMNVLFAFYTVIVDLTPKQYTKNGGKIGAHCFKILTETNAAGVCINRAVQILTFYYQCCMCILEKNLEKNKQKHNVTQ